MNNDTQCQLTIENYRNNKGESVILPDNEGMAPISEINMRRWANASKIFRKLNILHNEDRKSDHVYMQRRIKEAFFYATQEDIVETYDALDRYFGFKWAERFLDAIGHRACEQCGEISDTVRQIDHWSEHCDNCSN